MELKRGSELTAVEDKRPQEHRGHGSLEAARYLADRGYYYQAR